MDKKNDTMVWTEQEDTTVKQICDKTGEGNREKVDTGNTDASTGSKQLDPQHQQELKDT